MDQAEADQEFTEGVGQRLRMVRRAKGWSLDEVEDRSGGRWSASAVGAYERGFRNLSLPRLQELAEFYGVSMSLLLGDREHSGDRVAGHGQPIRVDLDVLRTIPQAAGAAAFLDAVATQRARRSEPVLAVRRADVPMLCTLLRIDENQFLDVLGQWGALASAAPVPEQPN